MNAIQRIYFFPKKLMSVTLGAAFLMAYPTGCKDKSKENKTQGELRDSGQINKNGANSNQASMSPSMMTSALLQGTQQLPQCTPERQAQLVFVMQENSFYHCDNSTWNPVSINGSGQSQDIGPSIVKSYEYKSPSISTRDLGDFDLCGECGGARFTSGFRSYITDISVREFKDNSIFLAVSGISRQFISDNDAASEGNLHRTEDVFTFTDIATKKADGTFELQRELDRRFGLSLYIKYDSAKKTVIAFIDDDNDLSNNMSEQNFQTLNLVEK